MGLFQQMSLFLTWFMSFFLFFSAGPIFLSNHICFAQRVTNRNKSKFQPRTGTEFIILRRVVLRLLTKFFRSWKILFS